MFCEFFRRTVVVLLAPINTFRMMKKLFFALLYLAASQAFISAAHAAQPAPATRADSILRILHDPHSKQVLVASHRGDWRNYPENSLPAIENAIRAGADIIEVDLALTRDSVLVICHDRTIDRTTNGHGRIAELTLDSVLRCRLLTGHGIKTSHRIPTLREVLELCRGKACINIDKGYQYYDLALAETERAGTTAQVLIKGSAMPEKVAARMAGHAHNMLYMPIIDYRKPTGSKLFAAYATQPSALAYEVVWEVLTPEVEQAMREVVTRGSKLWTNSLWPDLCGGLCDDAAYESSAEKIYGRHLNLGATIIQTDRIELLVNYLRSRGLHN